MQYNIVLKGISKFALLGTANTPPCGDSSPYKSAVSDGFITRNSVFVMDCDAGGFNEEALYEWSAQWR